MPAVKEVTVLLRQIGDDSETAPEQFLPLVYDELRKLASSLEILWFFFEPIRASFTPCWM